MTPSRQHRRLHVSRPPLGASVTYARALHAWLAGWWAHVTEQVTNGWEARHPHKPMRHDARTTHVHRTLGDLRLELEERFDPNALGSTVSTVAGRVNKKNSTEFKRVVGVSLHSETGVTAAIQQFRVRNVSLIKSLAGNELDRVSDLLDEAERGAWRVEELRGKLQEEFDVTKSKADLLARDQVLKLNGQLTQMRQSNAGITEYVWTTSEDERVRPAHEELDGTTQNWNAPPVISDDGRTGHPGDDYQCRCTAFPVIPALDDQDDS